MNEEDKKSQMSYASKVDIDFPPNKLDEASRNVKEQHAKAAEEKQKSQQGVNSEQVKRTAPPMQPNAPQNAKNAQARNTHNDKMTKDDEATKLYNAAKARQEQEKQVELDKDRDKER